MRRITYWALTTVSVLVLLFSYRTSTSSSLATGVVAAGSANANAGSGATAGGTDGSGSSSSDSTGDSSSASASDGTSASGSASATAQTYTGDAVSTRYGDVQVRITVVGGRITRSVVTQVPWGDHRDQEINGNAVPILNEETVSAQSAGIDMVSGATFTSEGYVQSLQSAIDQAHL